MGKLKKNKNAGITLIALVVTIIVLLILAGISIMMLSGNNGILNRAGEAKEKTVTKNLKEEVEMIISERQINKSIGQENKTVKEDIEKGILGATIEEIEGYTDVFYVKKDNGYVTVYEDEEIQEGKAEIWDGEKISCPEFKKENNIWNWYIYKPSQLKFLADFVNTGDGQNLPEGLKKYVTEAGYKPEDVTMSVDTKINLMNNLDMGARQVNGELTVGGSWTPIGINQDNVKDKLGTFLGNNNYIKGIYVKRDEEYNGVFGNSNNVKDLTVKDNYIQGANSTGGITGKSHGKIENCHNQNTIISLIGNNQYCGGGIVGILRDNCIINNCTNSGIITSNGKCNFSGGIVGFCRPSVTINNCINNGEINGNEGKVGGIIGGTAKLCKITNCINNAKVTHVSSNLNYQQDVGGIVGFVQSGTEITECINNGEVSSEGYFSGGIIGRAFEVKIEKCANNGIVTAKWNSRPYVGGIAGIASAEENEWEILNCYNTATINGYNSVGGIIGDTQSTKGKIQNCYNIGKINGSINIGGLIGNNENGTTAINSYYLTETANRDFGNIDSVNFLKDKNFITTIFVETSNKFEIIWKVLQEQNNGFPIF